MSLNISGSKYVKVYDPTIRLNYSDKVLFANLTTSRKTGNIKVDKSTGEAVLNAETGKPVQERAYSRWEGRFVGNAFEPSKGLRDGDSIDIVNGWITSEKYVGKDGKERYRTVVTISDFQPSEVEEGSDEATNREDSL